MPSRMQLAAEAVCGALYDTDWRFMGESEDRASTWFIRGDKPHFVRVEVQRSHFAEYLNVNLEWPVLTNPPHAGKMQISIDCSSVVKMTQIQEATERAVVRCLEVLRDVVTGEGLAAVVKTNPATSEDDSSVVDDSDN